MLAARAALASADESDEPTSNGLSDKGKRKELEFDPGLEGDEGKRLIAQILGFKFAYYQVRGAGEVKANAYASPADGRRRGNTRDAVFAGGDAHRARLREAG